MIKKFLTLALMLICICIANAQQQLPLNPDVKHGVLHNGLTYYILYNEHPQNRANFYIAQKVGSALETPEQYGLAQTANDSLVQAAAIVDGLFFDKSMPTKSLIPGESTIAVLKDPDGKMVIAVYPPKGYEMEASIVSKAIPADRVMFAKKLLRDYEGRRPSTTADYTGIGVKVGEPFIDFEYQDTEENVWNNDKLKGKVYVINLWQTECGPCRREMPILSEWKEKFPDVVFLSASRHNAEEILPIVKNHNFTWTHLQEAKDLVALVRHQGFPLTIVVDKEGIVRYAKIGASEENQAKAVATIKELLNK